MSGTVFLLLLVLAALVVLACEQVEAIVVQAWRHGSLRAGWAAQRAHNAEELGANLRRLSAWQTGTSVDELAVQPVEVRK